MTKKEFFDLLMDVPEDVDIVFGTYSHLIGCVPLNALNVSVIRQCANEPSNGGVVFRPQYKTAIVLDAIPYWYLKEKYNVTFTHEEE